MSTPKLTTAQRLTALELHVKNLNEGLNLGLQQGYARKTLVDGWYSSLWNDRNVHGDKLRSLENFRDGFYVALKMFAFAAAAVSLMALGYVLGVS